MSHGIHVLISIAKVPIKVAKHSWNPEMFGPNAARIPNVYPFWNAIKIIFFRGMVVVTAQRTGPLSLWQDISRHDQRLNKENPEDSSHTRHMSRGLCKCENSWYFFVPVGRVSLTIRL